MILCLGALLGFISVAFGAYAEHALRETITEEHFRFLMTAVRYNQVHAVAVIALGLVELANVQPTIFALARCSGMLFILGTVLFSFSIYASVTFKLPALVNITPAGGVTIMGGWLMLALFGYRTMSTKHVH